MTGGVMPVLGCIDRRLYLEKVAAGKRDAVDPCLMCDQRGEHYKVVICFGDGVKA